MAFLFCVILTFSLPLAISANVLHGQECDNSKGEIYLTKTDESDFAACKKACEDNPRCQSVTFYTHGVCSHFSTKCEATKPSNNAQSALVKELGGLFGKECDSSKGELYIGQSDESDFAACKTACENEPRCQSVTFYHSGACSLFSTKCENTKESPGAQSGFVKELSGKTGQECDTSQGEIYLSGAKKADFAECKKTCEDDARCHSITFWHDGFCSLFRTTCDKTKANPAAHSALVKEIEQHSGQCEKAGTCTVVEGEECDRDQGESYMADGSADLTYEACKQACNARPQCQSVTYYAHGWCSLFKTQCQNRKTFPDAISVTLKADFFNGQECDADKGEIFLSASSGNKATLAACKKSCQDTAECKSTTYFKSGWCSHYSTCCNNRKPSPTGMADAVKTAQCVDACVVENGGCDSKRACKSTDGVATCGDCPAGLVNDGATGCKSPAPAEKKAYVKTKKGEYCPSNTDIVTETECRAAAKELGLKFAEAWLGNNDHKYCLLAEDGRNTVWFNLAQPKNARRTPKPKYSSLCKAHSAAAANPCKTNNGGCDPKRPCTNTGGVATCGDCRYTTSHKTKGYNKPISCPLMNDGAKGCKKIPKKASNTNCYKTADFFRKNANDILEAAGQGRIQEKMSAEECQAVCKSCVPGCAYFSRWGNGMCVLYSSKAKVDQTHKFPADTVTGPAICSNKAKPNKPTPAPVADPCKTNNGGCHSKRKCKSKGAQVTCGTCTGGLINDGAKGCKVADPCKTNNGGCHSKRKCKSKGAQVTCGTCTGGLINDGAKGCKARPRPTPPKTHGKCFVLVNEGSAGPNVKWFGVRGNTAKACADFVLSRKDCAKDYFSFIKDTYGTSPVAKRCGCKRKEGLKVERCNTPGSVKYCPFYFKFKPCDGTPPVFTPKGTNELFRAIEACIKAGDLACTKGPHGPIGMWDVSGVTNMNLMFGVTPSGRSPGTTRFNGDISQWEVSQVTEMKWMFRNSGFHGDIKNWDVRNVRNMEGMFQDAKLFKFTLCEKWKVLQNSRKCNMKNMFLRSSGSIC